jgi:hypothetical protein
MVVSPLEFFIRRRAAIALPIQQQAYWNSEENGVVGAVFFAPSFTAVVAGLATPAAGVAGFVAGRDAAFRRARVGVLVAARLAVFALGVGFAAARAGFFTSNACAA